MWGSCRFTVILVLQNWLQNLADKWIHPSLSERYLSCLWRTTGCPGSLRWDFCFTSFSLSIDFCGVTSDLCRHKPWGNQAHPEDEQLCSGDAKCFECVHVTPCTHRPRRGSLRTHEPHGSSSSLGGRRRKPHPHHGVSGHSPPALFLEAEPLYR